MEISIVAPVFDPSGYSTLAREVCKELYYKGSNVKLYPINNWDTSNLDIDAETKDILIEQVYTNIAGYTPFLNIAIPEQYNLPPLFYTIGYSMIETSGIPDYWVRLCNLMNEIWVPTTSSEEAFVNSGVTKDIHIMPLGVDGEMYNQSVQPLKLIGTRGFNFLVNIEWSPRKCGEDVVRAFLEEFNEDDDVSLILKAYKPQQLYESTGASITDDIGRIKTEIKKDAYPPVVFIPQLLSTDDMPRLYASCDCVIQATHGEGWGLPITEGMATGKPYIATNWSGMTDIISDDTGYPLDITGLSKIPKFGVPNDKVITGFKWADPDWEHLKSLMRHVYEHQTEAKQKGSAGRIYIEENLTWKKAVENIQNRLQDVTDGLPKSKTYKRNTANISAPAQAVFVVPSIGKKCGIADYTLDLSSATQPQSTIMLANIMSATPDPRDVNVPDLMWEVIDRSNIMHFQFEYGLFSKEDILKANKFLPDKKLIYTHHAIDDFLFEYNLLLKEVFDYVVVHSDEMANVLVNFGFSRNMVKVIKHGCWKYGVKPKTQNTKIKNIVSFGFCFPQKGWIEMAIAISQLKDYTWNLYSAVVPNHENSKKYANRFAKFLERLDCDRIIWHSDYMKELDVVDRLRDADIIVLPYTVFMNQHAISGAARRCLAAVIPTMCTDITYFADLNEEVYKIHNNAPETIIEGILSLDKDKELREHMVNKTYKFINDNSWENVAKEHIDFWEGLV